MRNELVKALDDKLGSDEPTTMLHALEVLMTYEPDIEGNDTEFELEPKVGSLLEGPDMEDWFTQLLPTSQDPEDADSPAARNFVDLALELDELDRSFAAPRVNYWPHLRKHFVDQLYDVLDRLHQTPRPEVGAEWIELVEPPTETGDGGGRSVAGRDLLHAAARGDVR